MTHEASQPRQPFASQYPLPNDQLSFQMELHDQYAQQFPESQPVFDEAVADIQRAVGINIPKYPVSEQDMAEMSVEGLVDELGFYDLPFTPSTFAALRLRMPVAHTAEQIEAMSSTQRNEAGKTHDGMMIIGEMPAETHLMLESIYSLVGARIVRDERLEGQQKGSVIREGLYQGEAVWLSEEYYDKCPWYTGKDVLSVHILGKRAAEHSINSLNSSQRDEFIRISGTQTGNYTRTIVSNGVTKDNYKEIADVLGQAKDIIDGQSSASTTTVSKAISVVPNEMVVKRPEIEKTKQKRFSAFIGRIARHNDK